MSKKYGKLRTTPNGELYSMKGVYVVDGACLPSLTEKSHTLTIMANADRIGNLLTIRKNSSTI
jgi:choline dehydrogenase-like flavoprotein